LADFSQSKPAVGSPFPDYAVDSQIWDRAEPLITPDLLRRRFLFGVPLYSFLPDPVTNKRDTITNDDLMDHINRAVATIELESGITIIPLQYDEKYPFDRNWWESQGYIKVRNRPIASVEKVAFTPATGNDILVLTPDWIETANFNKGQINIIPLVPASSSGLVQATIGTGGAAFITIFYGKHWIPALIRVMYTCGFKTSDIPRALNEVIGIQATMDVLSMLAATHRVQGYSLNIDGGGQSVTTPGPLIFQLRLAELEKAKHKLMKRLRVHYGLEFHSDWV